MRMCSEIDNVLKFTSIHMQHPVSYTIYAVFKSLQYLLFQPHPVIKYAILKKQRIIFHMGYLMFLSKEIENV